MVIGAAQEKFNCPHCGASPSLHLRILEHQFHEEEGGQYDEGGHYEFFYTHLVYKCIGCSKHTYFLHRGTVRHTKAGVTTTAKEYPEGVLHQYPTAENKLVVDVSVPADVQAAAQEAVRCLAAKAPNACGVMARRAIHSICDDKKAKEDFSLVVRLEDLRDNHKITPDLYGAADDLREAGKRGAHPEWEDMDMDEAADAVLLLNEIIRYVYVLPKNRKARLAARGKKKKT